MVVNEDASISIPLIVDPAVFGLLPIRERCMGTLAWRRCYCVEVAENEHLPSKMSLYGLRYLDGRLSEPLYATAVKAVHLMEWEVTTRLSRIHALDYFEKKGISLNEMEKPIPQKKHDYKW